MLAVIQVIDRALGGSFGRDKAEMLQLLEFLLPLIPTDKPNHLLGVGDLESIEAGVRLCELPRSRPVS